MTSDLPSNPNRSVSEALFGSADTGKLLGDMALFTVF
jgi:hypothetical protein